MTRLLESDIEEELKKLTGWRVKNDKLHKQPIYNEYFSSHQDTFKYKTLGELPDTFNFYEADSTEVYKNSLTNHGFVAQEVKTAIDAHSELKDGFSMWLELSNGQQDVGETAIVPMLVKAVQELSAEITTL